MGRLGLRTALPAAVLVAMAAIAAVVAAVTEPTHTTSGSSAPSLSGPDLEGSRQDLTDLKGRIVLVNFWASWCAPCEEEVPVLAAAQNEHADIGLAVLGVNSQDRLGNARQAAQAWGADAYPSIHDEDGRLAIGWGVVGLPETFVIGPDGTILGRHKGAVTAQWLNETIGSLAAP